MDEIAVKIGPISIGNNLVAAIWRLQIKQTQPPAAGENKRVSMKLLAIEKLHQTEPSSAKYLPSKNISGDLKNKQSKKKI